MAHCRSGHASMFHANQVPTPLSSRDMLIDRDAGMSEQDFTNENLALHSLFF